MEMIFGTPQAEPTTATATYRGYRIDPNPYMFLEDRFIYSHMDYDGPGDNRCGTAATIEDAKREIDELEEPDP